MNSPRETGLEKNKTIGLGNIPWALLARYVQNLIRLKLQHRDDIRPANCGFYVTQRCNFNCTYCNVKDNHAPELNTQETIELLKKIRESVPSLTISGGEPLIRSDIVEILAAAKELGFNPINLFSNLSLADKKPEVLEHISMLSTSLDSLDSEWYDGVTGVPGSTEKIKANIEKYAALQKKLGFILNVNCVIGPENVEKVLELAEFVMGTGATLSIGPVLDDAGAPHPDLVDNPVYKFVVDQIMAAKKEGRPVLSSMKFLETIRDFTPFKCHPFLIPRVLPNGDLLFPCEILRTKIGNLLEGDGFEDVVKTLSENCAYGCGKSCFLGCYMEPSLAMEDPKTLLDETRYYRKAGIMS